MKLALRPVGPETPADLSAGRLDASFWAGSPPGDGWLLTPLFEERLIGVCGPDHPFATATGIDPQDWAAEPHAIVTFGSPARNPIIRALSALGVSEQIALVSPSFCGAMAALASSRPIMALPRRLLPIAAAFRLSTFPLPVALPSFPYGLLRHPRTADDPGLEWLTRLLASQVQETASA